VAAGACLINDVSGGVADPAMLPLMASLQTPVVLMHNRGGGASRDDLAVYDDVVADVVRELRDTLNRAVKADLDPARIVLDPGLGFAKLATHNWALLSAEGLPQLIELGQPLLIGASRKRFLATSPDGQQLADDSLHQREQRCLELTRSAVAAGVWCVRVHDPAEHARVVRASGEPARERASMGNEQAMQEQ
jgi:dihydropteroate synthase